MHFEPTAVGKAKHKTNFTVVKEKKNNSCIAIKDVFWYNQGNTTT